MEHYAGKEPCKFLQFDGFALGKGVRDDVIHPDADGDGLMSHVSYDLMSGFHAVRIMITAGTSKKDALRLIEKLLASIKSENSFEVLDYLDNGKEVPQAGEGR